MTQYRGYVVYCAKAYRKIKIPGGDHAAVAKYRPSQVQEGLLRGGWRPLSHSREFHCPERGGVCSHGVSFSCACVMFTGPSTPSFRACCMSIRFPPATPAPPTLAASNATVVSLCRGFNRKKNHRLWRGSSNKTGRTRSQRIAILPLDRCPWPRRAIAETG